MGYIDNEQKYSQTHADAKREKEKGYPTSILVISINQYNSNFFTLWHNIALEDSDCKNIAV
jgi:hypothetical protein